MTEIKGLKELNDSFQECIERKQLYLDSKHDPKKHPINVAKFIYALSFTEYKLRGDITLEAMIEFCRLYDVSEKKSHLLDSEVLVIDGNSLRLSQSDDADGFYCYM